MTPRLGVASIIVSISDNDGFVVRHGSHPDIILAKKDRNDCDRTDWDKLWTCLEELGLERQEI